MARIEGVPQRKAGPMVKLIYRLGPRMMKRLTGRTPQTGSGMEPIEIWAHQSRMMVGMGKSDLFTDREKLALDYTAAVIRTPVEVTDKLFAQMKEHFSNQQLVEVTAHLMVVNLDRFNAAFGIGSAGFSEGMVCVPRTAPLQTPPPTPTPTWRGSPSGPDASRFAPRRKPPR